MGVRLHAAIVMCVALGGCKSTWKAEVVQPHLVLRASEDSRTSMRASIVVKDMELPRQLRLANSAYYVVVSRDRVNFHVTLHHKWDDMVDVRTWEVWVEDEYGQRVEPEDISQRSLRPMNIGTRKPVYRGVADIAVYRRELFTATDTLTLVLKRPGYTYRYVWRSDWSDRS